MSLRHLYTALLTLCAALTVGTASAIDETAPTPQPLTLATATPGGTFYPVGRALATLATTKLPASYAINMSAIETAGSVENIRLLRDNEAQFAILSGLSAAQAWHKNKADRRELRAMMLLWQDVEHFVVSADRVSTGTVADLAKLKGRRFAIGEHGSGTEASGRHILNAIGIPPRSMQLVQSSYGAAAEALINGQIEGMNTPAGIPVSAVKRVFETLGEQVQLLGFNAQQLGAINRNTPLWSPVIIPKDTYPGQYEPVNTIAQPNFLAVRADVDEEIVYRITRAVYENIPFLNSMHEATVGMRSSTGMTGLPVPLHPGAARYFQERGLAIPAHLEAP